MNDQSPTAPPGSPALAGSEVRDAMRHANTLTEFYAPWNRQKLQPLVLTTIVLMEEIQRLRKSLERIRAFPVHSEPVGSAMAMQDIAHEALNPPND